MADLLVKLYDLPETDEALKRKLEESGIEIRRALSPEKHVVTGWVERHFKGWKDECEVAFTNHPVSCFIAVENGKMIGFACYDSTCKNYFGPTGVDEGQRGKGAGKALLLSCLQAMRADGYAYAIIGAAGPVSFYQNAVGAIPIEGSQPGIYRGLLKEDG